MTPTLADNFFYKLSSHSQKNACKKFFSTKKKVFDKCYLHSLTCCQYRWQDKAASLFYSLVLSFQTCFTKQKSRVVNKVGSLNPEATRDKMIPIISLEYQRREVLENLLRW